MTHCQDRPTVHARNGSWIIQKQPDAPTMNRLTYLPQQELTYAQSVAMVTKPGARNN